MITKYEYDKIMKMLPPHLFEELDAVDEDDIPKKSSEYNSNIKSWITEHNKSKKEFGMMIGIANAGTLRAKLNGQSHFSQKELKKIEEITSIDITILTKENPTVSQIRRKSPETRVGEYRQGIFDITFVNKSEADVTRLIIYPEKTGEEIIINVPEKDRRKNLLVSYSEKWGRNADMIVFFDDGTETYLDDLLVEEAITIWLKKKNAFDIKSQVIDTYLLMAKVGKASYECVTYLSKKQASYFIKKYGQVKTPLTQFMSGRNGGVLCGGKFCLVEDF